jgi:hypothetical protein
MDYTVIGNVSKGFNTAHETLDATSKILEAAIEILRAAAFFSAGTTLALANYLSVIKDKVNKLSQACVYFSTNLARAIGDHQKGDVEGKHYFEGELNL